MIVPSIRKGLYAYFGSVLEAHGACLIRAGGTNDHVHLLVSMGRRLSISDLVRELKSKSSGWIHRKYPRLEKFAWQAGYAGFSINVSDLDQVKQYIDNQEEHHRKRSFKEEVRMLLQEANISFNESYLWD